ncbi:Protein BPS1 [Abeliophyllum distichum]|uniref:Protein BPS1 n=1 Tax=Abeliophyllum distichum TaxID=126358 RepID=A0ABD1PBD3_9LAMI
MSNFTTQILLKPVEGSEYMSLAWVQKCFGVLDMINRDFARLVVEIDYPMTAWGGTATEEFLNYSLHFLDLLNSITSSVSHLSQAKISLFYALSLVEKSPSSAKENLLQIQPKRSIKLKEDFKVEGLSGIEEISCFGKEFVILQALSAMKSIEFWVLDAILSGLETRKSAGNFNGSNTNCLNSRFYEEMNEKPGAMEEVRGVNDAATRLAVALSTERCNEAAKELKRRLDVLENSLQEIEKQTKSLFSQVLATRNQLLENFRFKRHEP